MPDRDYQLQARSALTQSLTEFNRVLCEMATGTGKSKTMSQWIHTTPGKHLVVVTGDDLVNQLAHELQATTGEMVGIERASEKAHDLMCRIVVASIPTLRRIGRRKNYHAEHFDFIHYDEFHTSASAGGMTVIDHFTGAKLIGWTATPFRSDKQKLPYDFAAYRYTYRKAVKDGWLVPVVFDRVPLKIDARTVGTKMGDFDLGQVDHAIQPYLESAAREVASKPNGKWLIFLPLRATSRRMTEILNSLGMRSIHVDGETTNRKEIIRGFEQGEYNCMTNAMVFGVGTDIPCADHLLNLRLTKSLTTFIQINGRILRPSRSIANRLNDMPDAKARQDLIASSDKPIATIIDPLWLTKKHNMLSPPDMIAETEAERVKLDKAYRSSGKINIAKVIDEPDDRRYTGLVKEIRQHEHKKRELINPLDDHRATDYHPRHDWEKEAATEKQLALLKKQGYATDNITKGLASHLLGKIYESNDATPAQIKLLQSRGKWIPGMTKKDASDLLDKILGKYK